MSPGTKKKNMLLPATAIPASVLEEECSSLWDSACEKDSSLMHRPYHVAVSAHEWMSLCSAAGTFCSLPLGIEGLSSCLTFLRLWLMKFPWERTLDLKNLPTEASRHSWIISSVRGHLWTTSRHSSLWKTGVHKICPPPIFYCGHFPPVQNSTRAWALFHTWGMPQLSTTNGRQPDPAQYRVEGS